MEPSIQDLKDLGIEGLASERERLRLKSSHLLYSIKEIEDHLSCKSSTNIEELDSSSELEDDKVFQDAILENRIVLERIEIRIQTIDKLMYEITGVSYPQSPTKVAEPSSHKNDSQEISQGDPEIPPASSSIDAAINNNSQTKGIFL
ncbi:hypothetical protein DSO57_1006679 [Entomophthora muscae]|uniref:Uncharacterized protein n=1 Tax=Entomophthora muscae TaxID=34485 RepID=A0ACC2TIL5_9FUNG|nr:hypothetical protein DSO57_1006679 [Entomophthora muscae]